MPPRRKERKYCLLCRSELVLNRRLRKYPKNFCSRDCSIKYYVGEKSWSFKTGLVRGDGYARILIGGKKRYVAEHRYLMEKILGRKLLKDEVVHHIDGNKHNNELSNLRLIKSGEHIRLHNLNVPKMKLRKFPVLSNLPEAIEQEKVVSLLPEYRTYITKKCFGCGNLFWMRKDHELRSDKPACSSRCGHIVQGHHVNH